MTLDSTLGPAEWSILKPHHARGAVFWVSPQLDLLAVARAIAEDDTTQVSGWLQATLLRKPTEAEASQWDQAPSRTFKAIVIQPYVLMQELAS